MTERDFDPLRLDMRAFARQGGQLQGQWDVADLARLAQADGKAVADQLAPQVTWRADGELRQVQGGPAQIWLRLQAQARVHLECQRCLGPVGEDLLVDRHFLFVPDEATAEKLDADLEDDVLVLTRSLNLRDLVEDELLLALPIVPRHGQCPEPLPVPTESAEALEGSPKPFAALAALKRGRPPS